MGCNFCATGSMGFKSNLSSGEILEQLVHASRIVAIRNVVFMVSFFFFIFYAQVSVFNRIICASWFANCGLDDMHAFTPIQ